MRIQRRQEQKDQTRNLILEAAAAVLGERGFEGMNTRAVAERASVGVGTVFLHFSDKTALIEALLHAHIESAVAAALATLPGRGLVEDLVHVATRLFAAYDERPSLSKVYLREVLFAAGGGTERPLTLQLRRFEEWAAARCAEAVQRGEIGPIDPRLAFTAFFAFYVALLLAGLRGDMSAETRNATLAALVGRYFRREEDR